MQNFLGGVENEMYWVSTGIQFYRHSVSLFSCH